MSLYNDGMLVKGHLLTTREVADYLGVTPKAVDNWRIRGNGPRCHRNEKGRWVYVFEDIKDFVLPCDWKNAKLARNRRNERRGGWRHPDIASWLERNQWVRRETAMDGED